MDKITVASNYSLNYKCAIFCGIFLHQNSLDIALLLL